MNETESESGGVVCDSPLREVPFAMASGAGKAAQPPGPPGSTVNGTAADFANIDQELNDYQMHNKMCKKIAQLTKVRTGRGAPPAGHPGHGRSEKRVAAWLQPRTNIGLRCDSFQCRQKRTRARSK